MALTGGAAILNWFNIEPQNRPAVYEWHQAEHIPQRLSIPGFKRARRYIAERADLSHFILYEVDQFSTLSGRAYLDQLNDPSPWTRRSVLMVRNSWRALAHVKSSFGKGLAGTLLTLRFDAATDRGVERETIFNGDALTELAGRPEILGVHLLVTDQAASTSLTGDRAERDSLRVPGWTLLIEGVAADACEHARRVLLPDDVVRADTAAGKVVQGIYRLELVVSHHDR